MAVAEAKAIELKELSIAVAPGGSGEREQPGDAIDDASNRRTFRNVFQNYCHKCRDCCVLLRPVLRELQGSVWLIALGIVLVSVSDDPAITFLGFMLMFSVVLGAALRMYLIARIRRRHRGAQYQQVMQDDAADGAAMMYPAEMLQYINPTHLRLAMMERDFTPNDYETLLRLDEEARRNALTGIPQSRIESYPTHTVSASDLTSTTKVVPCAVCLDTPNAGDVLRTLPCLHRFHKDCVDRWLRTKAACPVCTFRVE